MKWLHRMEGFWAGVLAVGLAVPAQAALQGRLPATLGGTDYQAYYDTVLDVTWLADANLARSETFGVGGINASGAMTWDTAQSWIDAMNGTNYLEYNDWRLSLMVDVDSDGCPAQAYSGTDCGYNVLTGSAATTVYSELASLYYDTLGNLAYYDTSGGGAQPGWGLMNTGPFVNLKTDNWYWFGTEYGPNPFRAWAFNFDDGHQFAHDKPNFAFYVWAVRSGNVVPEPASLGLVGTVLGAVLGVGWRRRSGCFDGLGDLAVSTGSR
jgi:hypothetical protein